MAERAARNHFRAWQTKKARHMQRTMVFSRKSITIMQFHRRGLYHLQDLLTHRFTLLIFCITVETLFFEAIYHLLTPIYTNLLSISTPRNKEHESPNQYSRYFFYGACCTFLICFGFCSSKCK